MNTLVLLILTLTSLQLSSSAPKETLQPVELAMWNKLHQPWFTTDTPQKYPRKGEYPCKGGVCKTRVKECEGCQHTMPLK